MSVKLKLGKSNKVQCVSVLYTKSTNGLEISGIIDVSKMQAFGYFFFIFFFTNFASGKN